jgi:hypothetical protein
VATLAPGTIVDLSADAAEVLRFPPPDGDLTVVVHRSALRAGFDARTQVAWFGDDGLGWLGALGEDLLAALAFAGNVKDSQVELAHVWSLPASLASVGEVTALGRGAVERAVRAYVGG